MIPWRWMLENTLMAGAMALVVVFLCRKLKKHPALCHGLWLLVLVRLVMPPLPVPSLTSTLFSLIETSEIQVEAPLSPSLLDGSIQAALLRELRDEEPSTLPVAEPTVSPAIPVSTQAPVATRSWELNPVLLLLLLWAAGALVVWLRHSQGIGQVSLMLKKGDCAPRWLEKELARTADRMGIDPPRLKILPNIGSPFVWGMGRATLFWPAHQAQAGFTPGAASVLAHELAHLRRRDHLTAWFQMTCAGLLWWHPLFWVVRNRLHYYAEMACDAWAVWAFPKQRRAFAEALIDAADPAYGTPLAAPALGAYSPNHKNFKRRLTMILQKGVAHRVTPIQCLAGVAMLLLLTPGLAGRGYTSTTPSTSLGEAIEKATLQAQAYRYTRGQDYAAAADAWQTLIRMSPDNEKYHQCLGDVLLKSGDTRGAVKAFKERIALGDDSVYAWTDLARAYADLDQDKAMDALFQAARHGMTRTERLADEDFDALADHPRLGQLMRRMIEADRLMNQARGKNPNIEALDRLAELMPEAGKVYAAQGYNALRSGDYDEAASAFEGQIERGFDLDTAWYNLACAQALNGRADEALLSLEQAMDEGFHNMRHMKKDTDLASLRELPEFKELLSREIIGEKHRTKLERSLALKSLKSGDYEQALELFEQQALSGRSVGTALFNMSRALSLAGRSDEAIERLDQAIDAGYTNFAEMAADRSFNNLRDSLRFDELVRKADDLQALATLGALSWSDLEDKARQRIFEDPDKGHGYLQLGWSMLRQNREREAIPAFEKQEELGYRTLYARYNLACAYARLGETELAFEWLEAAVAEGKLDRSHLQADQDLANLRDDPRFKAVLSTIGGKYRKDCNDCDTYADANEG